jgi:hypothetical protein
LKSLAVAVFKREFKMELKIKTNVTGNWELLHGSSEKNNSLA